MRTGKKHTNLQLASSGGQTVLRTDIAADLRPEGGIEPDRKLLKRERELWDTYIRAAHWLTTLDIPKAVTWVRMQADQEKNFKDWTPPRFVELRRLGSELGLDPVARIRIATDRKKTDDPAEKYF